LTLTLTFDFESAAEDKKKTFTLGNKQKLKMDTSAEQHNAKNLSRELDGLSSTEWARRVLIMREEDTRSGLLRCALSFLRNFASAHGCEHMDAASKREVSALAVDLALLFQPVAVIWFSRTVETEKCPLDITQGFSSIHQEFGRILWNSNLKLSTSSPPLQQPSAELQPSAETTENETTETETKTKTELQQQQQQQFPSATETEASGLICVGARAVSAETATDLLLQRLFTQGTAPPPRVRHRQPSSDPRGGKPRHQRCRFNHGKNRQKTSASTTTSSRLWAAPSKEQRFTQLQRRRGSASETVTLRKEYAAARRRRRRRCDGVYLRSPFGARSCAARRAVRLHARFSRPSQSARNRLRCVRI
jgi:hypothetical protein